MTCHSTAQSGATEDPIFFFLPLTMFLPWIHLCLLQVLNQILNFTNNLSESGLLATNQIQTWPNINLNGFLKPQSSSFRNVVGRGRGNAVAKARSVEFCLFFCMDWCWVAINQDCVSQEKRHSSWCSVMFCLVIMNVFFNVYYEDYECFTWGLWNYAVEKSLDAVLLHKNT